MDPDQENGTGDHPDGKDEGTDPLGPILPGGTGSPALPGIRGLFVVLEGIDGSGKTSVGREVVERLNLRNVPAEFTFEPSDLPVGQLLREVLNGDVEVDAHTHALLFAADREEHLRTQVIPMLEKGITVICDRYVYASMAYQGAKGVPPASIWNINSSMPHFRVPDMILLLDVDPERSLERTSDRSSPDIFETAPYLGKVRANYLALAGEHGFTIIDAGSIFEAVVDEVMKRVMERVMER